MLEHDARINLPAYGLNDPTWQVFIIDGSILVRCLRRVCILRVSFALEVRVGSKRVQHGRCCRSFLATSAVAG